ncbi:MULTISPECIES: O-methyltransferase [Streptomyces]|uniref:O-methyltransferase n=1 Tax=Streptomyces sudanensis TaxID=436397 RepID=A0ABY4TAD7_9ACTN|nr:MULTISPECIES: O-methyltransferase [Streptomyces]MCP9959169.1 O-methyltransferase [Streptomyces sudanensis]MCP9988251.1 O-methyltransferase [Streptomyces sudanensis]MCQ0000371.1 O-methyltransferase [Streptomyces sudanensis]URN15930.1 O-methyltransferase [Streptomyces sudanensis]
MNQHTDDLQQRWNAVDAYVADLLAPADEALAAALTASDEAGLPRIAVAPVQGKLLHLLARVQGSRTILEIGTLGGYSAIWLARALPPDGRLISLEHDPAHAEIARLNLARAGLDHVAEVRTGAALDTLPKLEAEGAGPFDLVFVDADKKNNPRYVEWALRLTRPGSVIVVDNVVRGGRIVDEGEAADEAIRGTREMFDLVARDPRLDATAFQTVGVKGYDGMLVARVVS